MLGILQEDATKSLVPVGTGGISLMKILSGLLYLSVCEEIMTCQPPYYLTNFWASKLEDVLADLDVGFRKPKFRLAACSVSCPLFLPYVHHMPL